ncbi:MAG: hypothetical protein AB7Y46_14300 [Armatimonadota bacterium]
MRRLLAVFCSLALVGLLGCELSQSGTAGQQGLVPDQGLSEAQQQEFQEMKQLLKQYGLDLQTLRQQQEQQALLERAQAGPPDVVKDLWPTQQVLGDAMQAAQLRKPEESLGLLDRLDALAAALTADLPASQIITHCERALVHLQSAEPNLEAASAELSMAYQVAQEPSLPTLRPAGVDALIQTNAKGQISAGRPMAAAEVVRTVLDKAGDHWSLQTLNDIRGSIIGAREAVERGKWPVVEAELMVVHQALADLGEEIHLQGYTAEGEQAAPATEGAAQPSAGAEGAPQVGAEGVQAPPTTGGGPAAGAAEGAAPPAAAPRAGAQSDAGGASAPAAAGAASAAGGR